MGWTGEKSDRVMNALDLRRYNTEHLDLNAIELVEATPRTSLAETLESVAQTLVVHLLGAVENVA
jgi:hypothetical protein